MELYNHSLFSDSTLKAYYRFESGALATDSSGEGHTLTAISSPALGTGYYGGCIVPAGDDAYSVDHADFRPTGLFTIGCRVKTSSTSQSRLFHSRATASSKISGLSLVVSAAGIVTLVSGKNTGNVNGTDFGAVANISAINNGAWHLVIGGWDGSYLRLYIDGVLVASTAWAYGPAYQTTNYTRIACANDTGTNYEFLIGSLDDLFLFNGKMLSAAEVLDLYYEVIDAKLNLSAYYQNLDDLAAYLTTIGLTLKDMPMILQAKEIYKKQDGSLNLDVVGLSLSDFLMDLAASKALVKDFITYLSATDGTIFNNLAAYLSATDGNVLKDLGMYLKTIKGVPTFRAVTAHRLASVMSEVV